jgi:glyoxylase I family protein
MPIGTTNQKIPGCGSHHIAVQARDWEASLRLYRDVLGMPIVEQFGTQRPVALLDMGDSSFMEIFGPTPGIDYEQATTTPPKLPHFALATTDTRAATEVVRQAGYEVTVEPTDVQLTPTLRVTYSFFKGPSGELVEFFQKH